MIDFDRNDINSLKNKRAINSTRNMVIGFMYSTLITVMPFVLRTIIVIELGEQYLGLNSVFLSIMQLLNISEGFASVIVFFLYGPVSRGDEELTAALLLLLRRIYYILGTCVCVIILIIVPFIPRIVGNEAPNGENLYLLFIIYALGNVVNYFLYPELGTFFIAYQRNDINNRISAIACIITYALQSVALIIFHNYILFLVLMSFQSFFIAILKSKSANNLKELYGEARKLSEKEKKDIVQHTVYMVGHTLDAQLLNGVDSIIISFLCGLTAVAIYGNYFYIITAVTMLVDIIFQAVLASIGNAIATERAEDNYLRFKCMHWLCTCISGILSIVLLCVFQDFMTIWMPNLVDYSGVYIFVCIYFYYSQTRKATIVFKNAGGMWKADRIKPYIAMMVDIVLDYFFINKMGVSGAILASIITIVFIEMPWERLVLIKNYFKMSIRTHIKNAIMYDIVNVMLALSAYFICKNIKTQNNYLDLAIKVVTSGGFISIMYVLIYHQTEVFNVWRLTIISMIKQRKNS